MKSTFFLFLTVLLFTSAFSQISHLKRGELVIEEKSNVYNIIPVGKEGILVYNRLEKKNEDGEIAYRIQEFDTNFVLNWEKEIWVSKSKFLDFYDYVYPNLYLLFTKNKKSSYELIKFNCITGEYEKQQGTITPNYTIYSLKVMKDKIYMDGVYKKLNVPSVLDIPNNNFILLPYEPRKNSFIDSYEIDTAKNEVSFVEYNLGDEFSELRVSTYQNFEKIDFKKIVSDKDKTLLTARVNHLSDGEDLIIGTYSEEGFRSNGMFISKFDKEGNVVFKNYFNFTQFFNFDNHAPVKDSERLTKIIEDKKANNEDYNINYRLLVHDIIEKDGQYLLIAEAYYPDYRQEIRNGSILMGGILQAQSYMIKLFQGFRHSHAIIAAFNHNGEMLWDNSFDIEGIKSGKLNAVVEVIPHQEDVVLIYGIEDEIRSKVIRGNKVSDVKRLKIDLPDNEKQDMKDGEVFTVEHWYGNNFLVWGKQIVIERDENDVLKEFKEVFYFHKMNFKSE